ncbi:endonuclease domain-containing protein [Bordetella genomosp. 11]|nr:DUF559 domain-containing protein [Bordetella genomosp. 11]
MNPIRVGDDLPRWAQRLVELMDYPVDQVQATQNWRRRLGLIRRAYGQFQRRVDAGMASWMEFDPYIVGDWASILTPIELAVWENIRRRGLPMWPQLPVGRFFVDFGNPVKRVAIECDGAAYHDARRDGIRDAELARDGWLVYRIPGWQCMRDWDLPAGYEDWDHETYAAYVAEQRSQTADPIMEAVASHFPEFAK